MLSLVSSGDNDICLGELITFTCTGYEITYLQWNLTDHSGSYQSKIFSANYDAGIGMIENLNGFKVNLTRIDANGSSGNITLELSALVRLELNETIIECLTLAQDGKKSKQMILIVEGKVYTYRITLYYCLQLHTCGRLQCPSCKSEL